MACSKENKNELTPREKELVALGASIASNCIPCIEYHIPQSRLSGLSNLEIRMAIELADKLRKVPADKVMQTALALLDEESPARRDNAGGSCGCS
jgi:AhpD family alkylhydroperoxidase